MVEGNRDVGWSHQLRLRLPLRSKRPGYVPGEKSSGQEGGLQVSINSLEQTLQNLTEKENWKRTVLVLRKTQVQPENT